MNTPEIGMTIDSLIDYLTDKKREFGGDTPVAYAARAHDHGHNILARSPNPDGYADLTSVVWSSYHNENKVVFDEELIGDGEDCYYTDEEAVQALVLGL